MYEVKFYDFGMVEVEQVLFRSYSEDECWDFVRNHLTCGVPSIRLKAKKYVVMNALGRVCDPPMTIVYLKRNALVA